MHMALTSGFPENDGSKKTSPPTVGIPRQFPYPPMPATTFLKRYALRGWSSGPKRSEFRMATGRAPMVKMSRTMPPTPVAAPSYGSTALGWLCDSTLNTAARPSPISMAPAFSPGPCKHPIGLGRQAAEYGTRVLVTAMLAPHRTEHSELDRCRLAGFEQLEDTRVLVIAERDFPPGAGSDGSFGRLRQSPIPPRSNIRVPT